MSSSQTLDFLKKRSSLLHKIAPYSWLDDKYWVEYYFYRFFNYPLDLRNPRTFNEKIQWVKLYDRNSLYTTLSDKFMVRDYVEAKIGSRYLNDLLYVINSPQEIKWASLPDSFVIKTTHGSGWNIICRNKNDLDLEKATRKLNHWMKCNFYERFREWQYKNIKPKILFERYIHGDPDLDLIDYRIFCREGQPQIIQVELNTYTIHTRAFFDINWNNLNFSYNYPLTYKHVSRPEKFTEMLNMAAALSKDLRFCRVDFFIENHRLIFGEITITPVAGFAAFSPKEYDLKLGKLIPISG